MSAWQPDSAVLACGLCSRDFTLFVRRHHCRKCGRVVCASCSKFTGFLDDMPVLTPHGLVLPEPGERHLACKECLSEIQAAKEAVYATPNTTHPLTTVAIPRLDTPKMDTEDELLCPVCGEDIYILYSAQGGEYEQFKESHLSACLTSFDYSLSQQRFMLPPGRSAVPRNRMLVYNIAPIPEPSYEVLRGSVETLEAPVHEKCEECVICLEDLCPGDKVGRLECLCVFHYKCIKDWFNKKGYGECPVHYWHE